MSLSLPNNYKRSNIAENWVFQLFNENAFLTFDGSDDFINYGTTDSTISALTSNITISTWVKFPTASIGSSTYIFLSNTKDDHWTGFNVYKDQNDQISLLVSDGAENTNFVRIRAGSIEANRWYHIMITSNLSASPTTANTKIYINNVVPTQSKNNSGSISGVGYHASGKTKFAKLLKPDPDAYYGFSIKNFAIFNTQLDSNNRTAIYNSGNYRSLLHNFGNYNQSSSLQANWEFNSGENASIDLLGNIPIANISGAKYDGFLPVSYSDTMIDNIFYSGSVVSRNSTIRDTIDLEKSLAKSSNLSFDIADFQYEDKKISEDILFGTNYYINKTVKVFSQPDNTSSLSNCVQIYNGRLTNIDIDQSKVIKINVTAKRPWDYITIPQDKTPVSNIYVPVVYGDYNPNISSSNTPTLCDVELYPVPVLTTNDDEVMTLMPRTYSSGSNSHINMHQGGDGFLPFASSGGNVTDETKTIEDNAVLRTSLSRLQSGFLRAKESTDQGGTGTEFSNMHKAFDGKSNTFSTAVINDTNNYLFGFTTGVKNMFFSHQILSVKITHKFSSNATFQVSINPSDYTGTASSQTIAFSANVAQTTTFNILGAFGSTSVSIPFKFLYIRVSGSNGTMSISDVQCKIFTQVFASSDDTDDESDRRELGRIEHYYSGGDGLTAFNGWKTADSGLIKYGHEAHRDLLERFTNFNYVESDIYNWSSNLNINSLRNNWTIRWWALEPEELQKALENIQKEFAFVFKWRPDGTPSYWAIKNSYSSGDEVSTLTIDDISNIRISHTDFSSLITKMEIRYKMNPANKNLILSQTSEDTTTSPRPRQKWNIKDKENIQEVKLKYNYEKIGNTDVGSGNANDGYADYYMNIFGDIKKVVSCVIVNASKGYALETGDIIKFDIDDIKPFGGDWNGFYMITDLQRSVGKINIKCREVG